MAIDQSPKASAAPTFNIDSPENYTLFGKLAPNYTLTKIKTGNFTWYEFIEIGVNSTIKLYGKTFGTISLKDQWLQLAFIQVTLLETQILLKYI
ncbi:MAG: hypothetical protein ACFFFY_08655 [Promethearchaeota archaeon]